jgi:hypothetical protein
MKPELQEEIANAQMTSIAQRRSMIYKQGLENFFIVSRHYGLVSYMKDFLSITDRMRCYKVNRNFYKSMKNDHDMNVINY